MNDTSWNFQKFTLFMNEVFAEPAKAIQRLPVPISRMNTIDSCCPTRAMFLGNWFRTS